MRILVAVDGSKPSLKAVQLLIDHSDWYRYYAEEGVAKLASSKKKLDAAGIRYHPHVLVGPVAEAIVKHAKDKRCDLIYIGTRGMSALGKALVGSTATKVMHIADTPVLLVK